jgi:peptide/nickel transport system permease protein
VAEEKPIRGARTDKTAVDEAQPGRTPQSTQEETPGKAKTEQRSDYWTIVFRRLRRHRPAMLSFVFLLVLVAALVLAKPLSFGSDPFTYVPSVPWSERVELASPGPGHILGLDSMGRDVWSRLLYGGRISLFIGIFCSILDGLVSVLIGATSGYVGGRIDSFLMGLTDVMLSIPTLPVMIVLSAVIRGSLFTIVLIITAFGWMQGARLVRGEVLKLKNEDFIQASFAIGASSARIIAVHVLPNVMAPLIVTMTISVASNMISEASLSFLGVGIREPTPSWGNMLNGAQAYLISVPRLVWWPALGIFVATLAFNFFGDGLRDAMDPKLYR